MLRQNKHKCASVRRTQKKEASLQDASFFVLLFTDASF